jgi:hypothetical protein
MVRGTFIAALMLSQIPAGTGSTSGTPPVSPSVMATYMCRLERDGRGELELLLLWRGTPGWFTRNNLGGSYGGTSSSWGGSAAGGGGALATHTLSITQGGVNLQIRFEPQTRKLWIQEREVAINDDNVVLVDDVDSSNGPQIVRTLRIDPSFTAVSEPLPPGYPLRPGGDRMRMVAPRVQEFLRRSAEVVEFLRCGVVPPDMQPYEEKVFQMLCAAIQQP